MSAHLAIQTAIVSALAAAPALAGGNVRANAVRPLSSSQPQGVVVRLVTSRSAGQQVLGGPFDWTTVYAIECLARASGAGADPVAAVDGLLEGVWSRLTGLDPVGLGAIDVRLQPAIDWQVDDAETAVVAATVSLQIVHRTAAGSLAAQT